MCPVGHKKIVETIKEQDGVRTFDLLDDSAVSPHPEADEMSATPFTVSLMVV